MHKTGCSQLQVVLYCRLTTLTYRPLEVDGKVHGRQMHGVVVATRCRQHLFAKGAQTAPVHLGHVVLQAHAELCLTTATVGRRRIGDTVSVITGGDGRAVKFLEPQLKDALRSGLASDANRQLKKHTIWKNCTSFS